MSAITAFLQARIDEDERAAARMALNVNWPCECNQPRNVAVEVWPWESPMDEAQWGRVGPWTLDSARVLAESRAKRAILARHAPSKVYRDPGWEEALPGVDTVCGYCTSERGDRWVPDPCPDIRAVASVYADHPDFDPAWG